ncbi:MAG: AAA family ATPase, partial [Bacteroides sp.]|nr:AAA family ATPase [Bacteroides sp.]
IMQSVKYCEELREKCLIEKKSLIFETVLSIEDKIDYIYRAKQSGFFIRLFFVCTVSPIINASRIARRVMEGGHDVPISKIISRYEKSIANCCLAAKLADRTYVYDNSVDDQEAFLLFRLADWELKKQYTDLIPKWALPIL